MNETDTQDSPRSNTGRQAIVMRTYSTFDYTPEDLWNLRSTITEASLATGGAYTVVLLVDIKDEEAYRIHQDDVFYQKVLEESVPAEFQNMAVLFHKSLQKSWYEKVGEFECVPKHPFYTKYIVC